MSPFETETQRMRYLAYSIQTYSENQAPLNRMRISLSDSDQAHWDSIVRTLLKKKIDVMAYLDQLYVKVGQEVVSIEFDPVTKNQLLIDGYTKVKFDPADLRISLH